MISSDLTMKSREEWRREAKETYHAVLGIELCDEVHVTTEAIVASVGVQVIGFIDFHRMNSALWVLHAGGLSQDVRGNGLSLPLFLSALTTVKLHGAKILQINVKSENIAMILTALRSGFKIDGTKMHDGVIWLCLQKEI